MAVRCGGNGSTVERRAHRSLAGVRCRGRPRAPAPTRTPAHTVRPAPEDFSSQARASLINGNNYEAVLPRRWAGTHSVAVPVIVAVVAAVVSVLAALRHLQLHGRILVHLRTLAGLDGEDLAGGLVACDLFDGDG